MIWQGDPWYDGKDKNYAFLHLHLKCVKAAEELSQDKLQEYEDIFAFFDLDGNGSIDTDEFEQVCSRTIGFIGHYY